MTTTDTCEWCGGHDTTGTCPRSITCPRCGAIPGAWCRRPSGHRADQLHAERIALAEREDELTLQERFSQAGPPTIHDGGSA